ncbi:cupin domain-containing protein [Shewanella seohaensis]|uniref:(R)-mandelonitrile lyase n=1 Tax=Shewanella seohaensis TaxID=755175 RepID=UPI00200D24ED|nr:cupin domain-containing protein [Shewanella seohaensis]MCL1121264.1 cupin domain-containing protein [Shewanella seohaensis]UXM81100.1 cupin domain-containing protein [Shewanella seohaensis]
MKPMHFGLGSLLLLTLGVQAAEPVLASVPVSEARPKTVITAEQISIARNGTQLPVTGLEDYFTGPVRVEPLFQAKGEGRASGALVTFEPGSRTHWHTHPVGQTLIVTSGMGWVQQEGQTRLEIHPGDVVQIPANVKHWHGATSITPMTHIAIQEANAGKVITWLESVSPAQYDKP